MSVIKGVKETDLRTGQPADSFEEADKPEKPDNLTLLSLGFLLYSIIFHFVDVGYDLYVAHRYFITEKYSYCAWTVGFILVPSIIMTSISSRMYVEDSKKSGNFKYARVRITLCALGIVLQSAPLIRYCDSFWFAIKSLQAKWNFNTAQQERYYIKMSNEDSDVALLRVFECYLESAPQQVLQVTFLLLEYIQHSSVHTINQLMVLVLSFILMGVCMTNYHRCIRYDQKDKKKMSKLGVAVQFLWHMNFTVSRILAIVSVATINPLWTCVAAVCHWCSMTVWVAVSSKTNFCGGNKISEVFFSCAVGLVYIFNFINLKDGSTRKSYLIYYFVCFLENVGATVIWTFLGKSLVKNWIYYVFSVFPVLTSLLGIVFLVIYYKFLHPNLQKSDTKRNVSL